METATNKLPSNLHTALCEHQKALEAICDSFADEISGKPVPEILYHYTDDMGLMGILDSGKLWFTDVFSLNDPSELNHGIKHLCKIIETRAEKESNVEKYFAKKFIQSISGNVEMSANYFVCCFSQTGDDLGQWRAYADDGRGYAIGFNANALENAFTDAQESKNGTFHVMYNDRKLCTIHDQLVSKTFPILSTPKEMGLELKTLNRFLARLSVQLASSCIYTSLCFKHEAYCNEQEYRFLQVYAGGSPIPDLKFRRRSYSLVRYREFDWKSNIRDSIKEIVCGPACNRDAPKFARDCLHAFLPRAENIAIKQSNIPYKSAHT